MEPMQRTLQIVKTCDYAPEQYDVFDGDKQVGYMRLRWGQFTVHCPDVGGELVYSAVTGFGSFDSKGQRSHHLALAIAAIEKWIADQSQSSGL